MNTIGTGGSKRDLPKGASEGASKIDEPLFFDMKAGANPDVQNQQALLRGESRARLRQMQRTRLAPADGRRVLAGVTFGKDPAPPRSVLAGFIFRGANITGAFLGQLFVDADHRFGVNTFVLGPQIFFVLELPAKLALGCVSELPAKLLRGLIRRVLINRTLSASQRLSPAQPTALKTISTLNTFRYSTHDFFPFAASSRIEEEAITPPD